MMVYCNYIIFNAYASKLANFLSKKQEFLQEKKGASKKKDLVDKIKNSNSKDPSSPFFSTVQFIIYLF